MEIFAYMDTIYSSNQLKASGVPGYSRLPMKILSSLCIMSVLYEHVDTSIDDRLEFVPVID
ncbi:hypothetical protein Bhyg_16888 [Pseudolycoriella hygida]|uniref:Uncharacterized protein n=1 Tax=Pseudolycoriella hygida TaxID=35572 RepID=A0A9Q0MKG0_9DIPT|nr:hypothetical protein Bhyg_16888 [Pseudolycoriella hygida]